MRSLLLIFLTAVSLINAQNSFKVLVKDLESKEPLVGASIIIVGTRFGTASDVDGYAEIKNLPEGFHLASISMIGYKKEEVEIDVPLAAEDTVEIFLESESEEMEEISVTSTRGSRLIDDEPTRAEVISVEEIGEKINMDPSNISMTLSESTGIQVQQTSASSVNNTFRIQGLEGRYTQLLKDGFPLYTGFSGSLSISQILPLDLQQIEILKGSSSTLYGGGAIAGLINLVSKKPAEKSELSFLANVTSALGLDLSGYYSRKYENIGITFLAARNTQRVYDNNDDGFSDIPQIERYTVNPNFFFYFDDKNTFQAGGTFVYEDRLGGYVSKIKNENDTPGAFTEKNVSSRYSGNILFEHKLDDKKAITFKNSIGYFNRSIELPDYVFEGRQVSSFTELVYSSANENAGWIFGLNLLTDDFKEETDSLQKRDYSDLTAGLFVQNFYEPVKLLGIESGIRLDYNKDYGWFFLPRISLLIKWNDKLTSRIGGGMGYKIPNIFTGDAESRYFRNILPLDKNSIEAEKSYGINLDFNYKTILLNKITLSINQLFFYTRINDPLSLSVKTISPRTDEFASLPGHIDTRGTETNIKFTYGNYKLFAGYTFTDARIHIEDDFKEFLLTPKHKLGIVLFYEVHDNLRIGFEAYYTSTQKLSIGTTSKDYWINGLMIEKKFENISLFLNFENFLDTRQSKYGPMFVGSISQPGFVEIYAPTDGRIINGGVKINF